MVSVFSAIAAALERRFIEEDCDGFDFLPSLCVHPVQGLQIEPFAILLVFGQVPSQLLKVDVHAFHVFALLTKFS